MEFILSEEEEKNAREFMKKHKPCYDTKKTVVGGMYSYIFTPSGIGIASSIKCNVCGEIKDITDYGTW